MKILFILMIFGLMTPVYGSQDGLTDNSVESLRGLPRGELWRRVNTLVTTPNGDYSDMANGFMAIITKTNPVNMDALTEHCMDIATATVPLTNIIILNQDKDFFLHKETPTEDVLFLRTAVICTLNRWLQVMNVNGIKGYEETFSGLSQMLREDVEAKLKEFIEGFPPGVIDSIIQINTDYSQISPQ